VPYDKNTKKHDKAQINNVAESIKQYGFVQPIVIDKDNVVVNYEVGDNVKITDGPFKMLAGKIVEIDLENKKANVTIDLFGQETNVELELTQFTKE
jgi:transcription antitermination factor NusG